MTLPRRHHLLLVATVFLSLVAGQGCSLSPNVDLPSSQSGDGDDFGEGDGDFSPGDGDINLGDGDTIDQPGGMGGDGCRKSEPTPGGMGGATQTSCR